MSENKLIYKISPRGPWEEAEKAGRFLGAPIDLADGFIHFSTSDQVAETAAKHFAGEEDLVLAAIDTSTMRDTLKYEVSRGEALFPHLYEALDMKFVVWTKPMPLNEEGIPQVPAMGR